MMEHRNYIVTYALVFVISIFTATSVVHADNYWLEAETTDSITSPMQVANDSNASGGKFIYVPNGQGNNFVPNGQGNATYTVDITQAGEYVLWGRVIAPSHIDNSFYVEVGGSLNSAWQVAKTSSWYWDKVNIQDGVDPVTYYLQTGINVIKIAWREDGTKLDKLLLTDDMSYIPTGTGEDSGGGNDGGSTSCNNAWDKIMTTDRFELVMGGEAIKDNETCLVWEQSPNTSERSWTSALSHCFTKKVGGRKGWRAPTIEELATLVDETESSAPKIPAELKTLTSNVQSALYWSSTTYADTTLSNAWFVHFIDGFVGNGSKIAEYYVWCVRGGQGHDAY